MLESAWLWGLEPHCRPAEHHQISHHSTFVPLMWEEWPHFMDDLIKSLSKKKMFCCEEIVCEVFTIVKCSSEAQGWEEGNLMSSHDLCYPKLWLSCLLLSKLLLAETEIIRVCAFRSRRCRHSKKKIFLAFDTQVMLKGWIGKGWQIVH